jgi:xanthine dehydrogenase accessory factor
MQTHDENVIRNARAWTLEDRPGWLCTIVRATGSSPRPVGSMMACTRDGSQAGSVSGGCVEEDLLERLRNGSLSTEQPVCVEYGVSAEENERLGLPCGGRLEILVQALGASDHAWLTAVDDALSRRQCVRRSLELNGGQTVVEASEQFHPLTWDGGILRQSFGPRMRMLLVGAGQLAASLAELALAMDYEVLVTDTREVVLEQWEGPDIPLIQGMPDDVIRERANDAHSIIITLTHDPRIDDMALLEALTTPAWYIGALGSRRTTDKRIERLQTLGITPGQLERLHAPVGLDIGSKTPNEIAISIMAQLTQLRRRQSA